MRGDSMQKLLLKILFPSGLYRRFRICTESGKLKNFRRRLMRKNAITAGEEFRLAPKNNFKL